jgi:MFS family permease
MFFEGSFSSHLHTLTHKNKILFAASLMLLFWALFDGLLSYLLPLIITDLGFSATKMGLIIASSNVFGALYDFFLAKFIPNTNYRRLFLFVNILCFIYPLILWSSKTLPLFLVAMAVWGLYGDLNEFAIYDFVSRRSSHTEHSQSFGIIAVFKSLGYLIAPIIAGLVVVKGIDFFPFSLSFSFIIISLIFYLILIDLSPKKDSPSFDHTPKYTRFNFFKEFHVVKQIARILFPVLVFNILLYLFDGVFWTIGPIYSQSFTGFKDFGGFFMTAYTLPALFVGWFIKPITSRFGKKRTAYVSFIAGCLFLLPISFVKEPVLIIFFVFLSSVANSIAWPSIHGAYADYISESHLYEKEISSLNDLTFNIGYVVGPAISGILADRVGIGNLFLVLVVFSLLVTAVLLKITPRNIRIVVK